MSGLCLFLTGVASGFMPVSQYLGGKLMAEHSNYWVIFIGFTLGVVAILAEPAIYVLIDEIEEVTGGSLRPMVVLLTIALGVGFFHCINNLSYYGSSITIMAYIVDRIYHYYWLGLEIA